jgi:phosphohistidine phosphatase
VQDQGSSDAARPHRRIAVIRHGKAEQVGRTDFERELADRGRHDSADAGAWLARQGFVADHALVSAAHRAVGTWQCVAEGAEWELEPTLSQGLYMAGPESALDLVREAPTGATAVVVIGHNPTMAYLASLLDDGDGDAEVASAMLAGYPTSAVAVFEYDGEWADLDEAGARLVAFHVGRA